MNVLALLPMLLLWFLHGPGLFGIILLGIALAFVKKMLKIAFLVVCGVVAAHTLAGGNLLALVQHLL